MSLRSRDDLDYVLMPPDPNRVIHRDPRVSYYVTPQVAASLQQCPYDPYHWIRPERFGTHLLKCRHNYLNKIVAGTIKPKPGEEMVICKWNSSHHVVANQKKLHEEEKCDSNQDKIDADKIRAEIEITKMRKYFPCDKMPPSWAPHLTPADKAVFATFKKPKKDDNVGEEEDLKAEDEFRNARGLTKDEMLDPNENWEICPIVLGNLKRSAVQEDTRQQKDGLGGGEIYENDVVKFTGYDPRVRAESLRTVLFNNPQGLTKSEKRAYHAKTEEMRLAKMKRRDGPNN